MSHAALQDKVVVVTGASAGVGRATVRALARHGARIGLLARGMDGLAAARGEIQQAGAQAVAIPTDVARADEVEAAAEQIEQRFGPIEVWINNAITTVMSPFVHMQVEEFRRVTDVCYHGYVHGTLMALRRMVPRNRGTIVQVGSALAYRGIPLQSAYCGAKHAIRGFTDSLRAELLHEGSKVRLTMVQLPGINTPQFEWSKCSLPGEPRPVAPVFQPEIAADAIVYAATHAPRELNVGLSTNLVIAGQKLAPGLGDRYLAHTAFNGQLRDTPRGPGRQDNLWQPLDGDFGARGPFSDEAHQCSIQWNVRKHRWLSLGGALGALAMLAICTVRRR